MTLLYLSDAQVRDIIGGDTAWVVDIMKKMFETIDNRDYALGGDLNASHGMRMSYELDGAERLFIAMPAYLGGSFDVAGAKWHGPNAILPGRPTDTNYLLILNDMSTGVPFAVMSGESITMSRTAGVSVCAASELVRTDPTTIGIIGPGKINTAVALALIDRYPSVRRMRVKGRGAASLEKFISTIEGLGREIEISAVTDVKSAVEDADIVSLNTGFVFDSYGDMPTIRASWIRPGAVFLCSAFAHFPDSVITGPSIKVCDLFAQYESYEKELGYPAYKSFGTIGNRFADMIVEGKLARDDVYDLGEIITGRRAPARRGDEPVIFCSGGLATEDIALGMEIYKRARSMGIGTVLDDQLGG